MKRQIAFFVLATLTFFFNLHISYACSLTPDRYEFGTYAPIESGWLGGQAAAKFYFTDDCVIGQRYNISFKGIDGEYTKDVIYDDSVTSSRIYIAPNQGMSYQGGGIYLATIPENPSSNPIRFDASWMPSQSQHLKPGRMSKVVTFTITPVE